MEKKTDNFLFCQRFLGKEGQPVEYLAIFKSEWDDSYGDLVLAEFEITYEFTENLRLMAKEKFLELVTAACLLAYSQGFRQIKEKYRWNDDLADTVKTIINNVEIQ